MRILFVVCVFMLGLIGFAEEVKKKSISSEEQNIFNNLQQSLKQLSIIDSYSLNEDSCYIMGFVDTEKTNNKDFMESPVFYKAKNDRAKDFKFHKFMIELGDITLNESLYSNYINFVIKIKSSEEYISSNNLKITSGGGYKLDLPSMIELSDLPKIEVVKSVKKEMSFLESGKLIKLTYPLYKTENKKKVSNVSFVVYISNDLGLFKKYVATDNKYYQSFLGLSNNIN